MTRRQMRCVRCKRFATDLCAVIPGPGSEVEEICDDCFAIAEYHFALDTQQIPRAFVASVVFK